MASNKKKCFKCGTENLIHAEYCAECGEKLYNNNSPEVDQVKGNNPLSRVFSKWKRQNKETKILTSFLGCCLGITIFLVLITLLFPVTALSLENDSVQIDNQTTNYTIKGETETNATVKISSDALNLNNVEVKVEEDGSFEHQIKIPIKVTELEVEVIAKAPNKSENTRSATIKRPLTTLSVNEPTELKSDDETLNIKGTTDPNTEVNISSEDLNIKSVKVNSDSKGNFNGKIKVVKDKSNGKIKVTAKAVGKRSNYKTVEISREPKKTTTPTKKHSSKENKTTSDMVYIKSEKFERELEGTPLYDEDISATIEMGDRTYFVDFWSYQKLLKYFGMGGTNKPFYAKVETRQVLLNNKARVITNVFDLNGESLPS